MTKETDGPASIVSDGPPETLLTSPQQHHVSFADRQRLSRRLVSQYLLPPPEAPTDFKLPVGAYPHDSALRTVEESPPETATSSSDSVLAPSSSAAEPLQPPSVVTDPSQGSIRTEPLVDPEQPPAVAQSQGYRTSSSLNNVTNSICGAVSEMTSLDAATHPSHNTKANERRLRFMPSRASVAADQTTTGGAETAEDDNGTSFSLFTTRASPDSMFSTYHVPVNPYQEDRAVEIPLYSFQRPHMRAFHLAWLSFFVAFFAWFAITPLLSEIADTLHLDKRQVWTSNVLAVTSSAVTRMWMGPLNDQYGARFVMAWTLFAVAIPTGLSGLLIQSSSSLYIVRLLVGLAGSAFVTCQSWTTSMFTCEVAGTANALAAGWGNLGGGVAQVLMGSILFPLFKIFYSGNHDEARASELSWRTIFVFPALFCLIMAWAVVKFADDTPKGTKPRPDVSAARTFRRGASNWNTWLLFIQYGCCFGVEITMTLAAALYYTDEFGQPTESAAAIASVFGWMNLFARGIGGFCSDMSNAKAGFRGRLWCQAVFLLIEGALVILFSFTDTLAGAIVVMMIFSAFVQAAEGSTFGVVPYVDTVVTGSIAGIVGAGGNVGGIGFALLFWALDYRDAFLWMGLTVLASAGVTAFISVPGHRTLLGGQDSEEVLEHRRRAGLPATVYVEASEEEFNDRTSDGDAEEGV